MAQAKKSAGGAADRLKLLKSYAPDVHQLLDKVSGEHPRRDVCPDDVLDATVALLTARAPKSAIHRMCGNPTVDQIGLPIEMLYAVPYER